MFIPVLLATLSLGAALHENVEQVSLIEQFVAPPSVCFFSPPKGWEVADPKVQSPRVAIAFMKPKKQGFCPSVNLAVEPTTVSLAEYLKIIKKIHEQDRNNQWRELGKVHTAAGPAQLTQIDTSSEWGTIRMLQLILIKNSVAYVLTAAALKEEFSTFYKDIQTSFRSLTLAPDLLQAISQSEKREGLKEKKELMLGKLPKGKPLEALLKEPVWLEFEKEVVTHASEMGLYWQLLVLKEAQEALLNRETHDVVQAPTQPPAPLL